MTTNLEVIRQFLEVEIDLVEEPKRVWTVVIGGRDPGREIDP